MIREGLQDVETKLFFSVQSTEDLFYLQELSKIPNVETHVFLTQEKEIPKNQEIQYHT